MADLSTYKGLELPKNEDRYNIEVFNQNNMIIDSELHKLELKNQSQDDLLATKEALDAYYQQSLGYTDQKIADLIGGAPSTLDTLGEISEAMQNNPDVVVALEDAIGGKADEAEFSSYKNVTDALIGNTDISDVGDGTITGAINAFQTYLNTEMADLKKSVADGKASVASAITEKGIPTAQDATFAALAENIGNILTGGNGGNITPAGHPSKISYGLGSATAEVSFQISDEKKYLIVADGGEVNMNTAYDKISVKLTAKETTVGTVLNDHIVYNSSAVNSGAIRRKSIFYITDGTNQTITLTVKATTFNGYGDGSGKYAQGSYAEIIAFRLE